MLNSNRLLAAPANPQSRRAGQGMNRRLQCGYIVPGSVGVMVTFVVGNFPRKLIVGDYWGMWELKAESWVQDVIRMKQKAK